MLKDKKIIVVMPAYNAAKTLRKTYEEVMAQDIVDLVVLVDDGSNDETAAIARSLPDTRVFVHKKSWLWCKPENLLPDGPGRGRRYHYYDSSGLPVYSHADSRHGPHD